MESYTGPVFDADNHYYEALDAFTRYVPRKMQRRCVQVCEINGKVRHLVGGRVDMQVGNPSFNPISKPGVLHEYFNGNPEGLTMVEMIKSALEPLPAEYMNRDARLNKLEEQGLEAAWLFPTLGVLYEQPISGDVDAVCALFEGFNRWLDEDWGLNYENKLYSAPYIPLADVDWACKELEWALKQDARIITLRPASVRTRKGSVPCTDKQFAPFWERVNESGIAVIAHVANSGYTSNGYGSGSSLEALGGGAPSVASLTTERAINDWLLDMVYSKHFERYPNLRIGSIESGAGYLPSLMKKIEVSKMRSGNYYKEDPLALFHEHVWINPFWEDNIAEVVGWMGADRVILGSDWPHMEGTANPRDVIGECNGVSVEDQEKILYSNTLGLTELRPA